jgi:tRNA pseudouridine55 synthase
MQPPDASFDGLLLVDKPAGWTSHDVVARVRNRFHLRKIGHGGTLDPAATGLLVLLLGRATRISDRVMGHDKTYEGVLRLGTTTTTQDAEGEPVAVAPPEAVAAVTEDAVRRAFADRIGDQYQTPPMVSAIRIGGVHLYAMARRGEEIERPARLIHVYSLDLLSFSPPDASFRVECTKGTYVRTLAHDIGAALGPGGHLAALRRTRVGPFDLSEAIPLDALLALPTPASRLLPLPDALARLATP